MVKLYLLRHAQSQLNLLKDETMKKYNLEYPRDEVFVLAYKFMKSDILMDATITELGKAQCKISSYKNAHKFEKV